MRTVMKYMVLRSKQYRIDLPTLALVNLTSQMIQAVAQNERSITTMVLKVTVESGPYHSVKNLSLKFDVSQHTILIG